MAKSYNMVAWLGDVPEQTLGVRLMLFNCHKLFSPLPPPGKMSENVMT